MSEHRSERRRAEERSDFSDERSREEPSSDERSREESSSDGRLREEPAEMSSVVLGVVIDIPQPHAGLLRQWRRKSGDAQADRIWPHITLLPPTEVAADVLDVTRAHLAEIAKRTEPFSLHLAGTGTFRPTSPVVFIRIARGASDCELLAAAIRSGPLERSLDHPYHPHITVAHHVPDDALDDAFVGLSGFGARFEIGAFQLQQREPSGRWTHLSEHELGTG